MSNRNPTDYPIDQTTTSGTDLARILERTENARNSGESATTRPAYITKGGIWSKLETNGTVTLYLYDGANDIAIGYSNSAALKIGTTASTAAAGNHTHNNYLPLAGGTVTGALRVQGAPRFDTLGGGGSQMVTVDNNGNLGAAAIPNLAWANITGKPTTFLPTIGTTATTAAAGNHSHSWAQVTGKPSNFVFHSNVLNALEMIVGNGSGNVVSTPSVKINNTRKDITVLAGWKMGIGVTPTVDLEVAGEIKAASDLLIASDKRLKRDIAVISNALSKLNKIKGCTFTRTDSGKVQAGLIAQDVASAFPLAVHEDGDGTLSVSPQQMIGLLVAAINELSEVVDGFTGFRSA